MAYDYNVVVSDGFEQACLMTEAMSVRDYDGCWRQIQPYNRRLIPDEMGYFKLAEQTPIGGGENDKGIPIVQLYSASDRLRMTLYTSNGLHFGLVGKGVFHTKAAPSSDSKNSIDPRSFEPPLVYKVLPLSPDLRLVWGGMAFKTSSQLLIGGQEALAGFMINAATGKHFYFIVKSERWAPGFGGDAGAVLCIATGFKDLREMIGFEIGGPGVSISLGYNWSKFLQALKDCPKSVTLFGHLPKAASGLKSIEIISKACLEQENWLNWAKLLVSDTECDKDQTLSFFEIPGPGVGLELKVCNTIGKVVAVGYHDEVCRYAARTASASRDSKSKYVRQVSY